MKDLKEQFNQYKSVLCLLGGVILVILAYLYGFNNYNDKKSTTDAEIKQLQSQYDNYKKMFDNKSSFESKTKELNSDYDKLLAKYDGGITDESIIMDTVKIEQKTKALVTSLGMTPNSVAYTFGTLTSTNPNNPAVTGINADQSGIMSKYSVIAVGKYTNIKNVLKEFVENDKRKVITDASFTTDTSNGDITLTMSINEYAITGKDRKQSPVVIPTTPHNVKNIFGDAIVSNGDAQ